MNIKYNTFGHPSIELSGGCEVSVEVIRSAIEKTNYKLLNIKDRSRQMHLNVFSVLDFRMLSGMIGEALITELAAECDVLQKNPWIDGYPDLLTVSSSKMTSYYEKCVSRDFIDYKYGGIEVKNTFGTKKSGALLEQGAQRIGKINTKLDWKAHHRKTNHLLGLFSDYLNGTPTIVAAFYSSELNPDDWGNVQRPKSGSAMTSFSAIKQTGYKKLKDGIILCVNSPEYLNFFT